jgi:hypothetical protein
MGTYQYAHNTHLSPFIPPLFLHLAFTLVVLAPLVGSSVESTDFGVK